MKKSILIFLVTAAVIASLIIVTITLINLGKNQEPTGKLYTFPLSVEGQTYVVNIKSNYTNAPEVNYYGLLKSVYFEFKGPPENAFCNITIPNNLIWGELSVYAKGYKMSEESYIQVSNSTHNSIYFTFNHTASVKTFDVKGTQGVQTVP